MHYAQKTKFSWHKSLKCPECAHVSVVHCSVHETCAERFLLHCSFAFCSPYIPGRKKTKNKCTFRTYVQNSFNKDSHVRKPTVPKVTHNGQKRTFPWHTTATCPEGLPIRVMRYRPSHESEKHGKKHGFIVICVSAQRTSNQSHALSTSNRFDDIRQECALLCLEQCSVAFSLNHAAHYFRMNTHQEGKTHEKISRFRCYLTLCVHWTWNQSYC